MSDHLLESDVIISVRRQDAGHSVPDYSKFTFRSLSKFERASKRTEDLIVAFLLVVITAPVMLAVAVAITHESRGPILFKQWREGMNGRLIRIYKFRSMYTDRTDEHCSQQTGRHDPRVTRVGRFIRKHSLDELPQLFNVLRGEMSLVGPRPHARLTSICGQPVHRLHPRYEQRSRMKPGITGWAQVNGWRGNLDTTIKLNRRLEFDIDYIENWSLMLDLKILARTLVCAFADENAF